MVIHAKRNFNGDVPMTFNVSDGQRQYQSTAWQHRRCHASGPMHLMHQPFRCKAEDVVMVI
ncbi:hypothetical protein OH492_17905 [Vibrio chagasii]|nr:hypothetical protein [Vibrio chagasii]